MQKMQNKNSNSFSYTLFKKVLGASDVRFKRIKISSSKGYMNSIKNKFVCPHLSVKVVIKLQCVCLYRKVKDKSRYDGHECVCE